MSKIVRIFGANKSKIDLKIFQTKIKNQDVELQVQEVQEHNMRRADEQVMEAWIYPIEVLFSILLC